MHLGSPPLGEGSSWEWGMLSVLPGLVKDSMEKNGGFQLWCMLMGHKQNSNFAGSKIQNLVSEQCRQRGRGRDNHCEPPRRSWAPRRSTSATLKGTPMGHPLPYAPRPAAVPLGTSSQKTQTGVPILSDEELVLQLFQLFGGVPIGGPSPEDTKPSHRKSLT